MADLGDGILIDPIWFLNPFHDFFSLLFQHHDVFFSVPFVPFTENDLGLQLFLVCLHTYDSLLQIDHSLKDLFLFGS